MYPLLFLFVSFSLQNLFGAQTKMASRPNTPEFQEYTDKKLRKAAGRNDDDYIKILIERDNAQVNSRAEKTGRTALHKAIIDDCAAAVDILLQYGADPEIKDKKNKTAIEYAYELERKKLAAKLLRATLSSQEKADAHEEKIFFSCFSYIATCFCLTTCRAAKHAEL